MAKSEPKPTYSGTKDRHALQKVLIAAAAATAAYAAGKIIETKRKKKVVKKVEEVEAEEGLE